MPKIKIMLDPGHGGRDPGACANGLEEKTLTLSIARHIRKLLLPYKQVEVSMTRDKDTFVPLETRAHIANEWGADLFLSVHVNAGGGSGFESFIYPSTSRVTKKYQKALHKAIVSHVSMKDRKRKTANFSVLRGTRMPALLTENLFIDHPEDSDRLKDPAFLESIAGGHVDGLVTFLGVKPAAKAKPNDLVYRVIVNGEQVGAYREHDHVLSEINSHLGSAKKIEIKSI